MKRNETEDIISGLKPRRMPAEAKSAISEKIRILEERAEAEKPVQFPSSWRAVILKAAAILVALAGLAFLISHVTHRSDSGAPVAVEYAVNTAIPGNGGTAAVDKQPEQASAAPVDPMSLVPVSIRTHLLSESDEGIVMTPQGPMRLIKYNLRDDYEWPHPYSHGRTARSVPREHLVLTGVNSN